MNIKGVPNRSPFRYPGGKTWLIPRTRAWLASQPRRPQLLVEPFAGGASVGLDALGEGLVERLLLVELDPTIAAVWRVLASGQGPALADAIAAFECDREHVMALLATPAADDLGRALATIVKNRTFYGGIVSQRSRPLVAGGRGLGISSRWYPTTLGQRIAIIHAMRDRLDFIEGDGLAVLAAHADEESTVAFIDPPYTAGGKDGKNAGASFYGPCTLDHESLFATVESLTGDFLMTYDDAPPVVVLAGRHHLALERVAMKTNRHASRDELLIGRDLSWLAGNGTSTEAELPIAT